MFINRLNQLYRPERVLYYSDKKNDVEKYVNGFGTYDYPGLFFFSDRQSPVYGIEYRKNDDRIAYPNNLKSVVLPPAFFYSIEIDNDIEMNVENIRKMFSNIAEDDDAHRAYSDFSIKTEPDIIAVFESGEKARILYELKLERDVAIDVIKDDHDRFEKETLYRKAFFDPVTDHYNWNHITAFLEMPMDGNITDYAFVHFDVKEFRVINEVYGHIAANKVLSNIVKAMNESDFVYASARCHNDNFAMMIKDMPEEEMKSKLSDMFEKLSRLEEDPNYRIYYRCGVVPMQRAMLSGNRVADAGKLAQSLGTNTNRTDIVIYTDSMHDDILWANYIKAYVDTAVSNDEFLVYLQPKFDIHTEKIKGAEALVRWHYKGKEMLAPYRFIPFFERDGSIGKIDDVVLEKVCSAFDKWKTEGRPLYPISVNLSRSRLYDQGLVDHLADIVDRYGIDHALIDFELTESASYEDKDRMISVLNKLKDKGFAISMDDFGTGYSSLSLLTELSIDTLKIDKSFVDKIGTPEEKEKDITVIKHIISLAKEIGITCLAEGAEHEGQVGRLRKLGCEVIQGYYYSRPVPITKYENNYLNVK
ncbi:MAG: EAL domain-containing protein [Lachnospiraceae bacterium]|nr:EAL domain-containing protein [Lachnospiraceae bacterium]